MADDQCEIAEIPEIPKDRQLIHDLRQCLYSIHLAVQILQRNRENEEKFNELCALIDTNREQAVKLVEAISSTRKIES